MTHLTLSVAPLSSAQGEWLHWILFPCSRLYLDLGEKSYLNFTIYILYNQVFSFLTDLLSLELGVKFLLIRSLTGVKNR